MKYEQESNTTFARCHTHHHLLISRSLAYYYSQRSELSKQKVRDLESGQSVTAAGTPNPDATPLHSILFLLASRLARSLNTIHSYSTPHPPVS